MPVLTERGAPGYLQGLHVVFLACSLCTAGAVRNLHLRAHHALINSSITSANQTDSFLRISAFPADAPVNQSVENAFSVWRETSDEQLLGRDAQSFALAVNLSVENASGVWRETNDEQLLGRDAQSFALAMQNSTAPRPQACKCESDCRHSQLGKWCFVQSTSCTVKEPCTVNGEMTNCISVDQASQKPWTRCSNILLTTPCTCSSACTDTGVGPWCWTQSDSCAVKEPCAFYSEGEKCIAKDNANGSPWTRCENILNSKCTVYSVQYPLIKQNFVQWGHYGNLADPEWIGHPKSGAYIPNGATFMIRHEEQLKAARARHALMQLTELLKKHGIMYWLEGGTLLGSYRHGMFIPWDDDVDITVPIKYSDQLFKVVQPEAERIGISLMRSWISDQYDYYRPITTYIQKIAPKVAKTRTGDGYSGTLGYFNQAWYDGLKIDIWMAFPVVLDGKVLYSNAGGATLFPRNEVFPLRNCLFEGRWYTCPSRTNAYLQRLYKDISVPKQYAQWWNQGKCEWDHNKISKSKFRISQPGESARIVLDQAGNTHMEIPQGSGVLPDHPSNYNSLDLGYGPGIQAPR